MALSWKQVHLRAAVEAARAHRDLDVDTTRPIDPFAALDASGILAFRRRLDGVAGLYMPGDGGSTSGVLINVVHPLTKQRFTAAHELWHHRRDREFVLDTETEWFPRGEGRHSDRERLAEAFAAWFLMPRRLVESTLTGLSLDLSELEPDGAYALALAIGTSYAATVHHLGDIELIDRSTRDRLARFPPQRIKRSLGGGDALADSWKDVHLIRLRGTEEGRELRAEQGDVVVVEVPETPSTGYIWEAVSVAPGLALVGDEHRTPDERALGARGLHRFLIRVDAAGQRIVRLDLRRPWDASRSAESVRVGIMAEASPTPGLVEPRVLVPA